jgi:hypothetical protein
MLIRNTNFPHHMQLETFNYVTEDPNMFPKIFSHVIRHPPNKSSEPQLGIKTKTRYMKKMCRVNHLFGWLLKRQYGDFLNLFS